MSEDVTIQRPAKGPAFIKSRGLRFPNDARILLPRVRRALRKNGYEGREAEAVRALVRREDVVIELGAGIGFLSALMARNIGVRAVHAFEANPRMIPYIKAVYRENGIENAHIHNAILGARKGSADFYVRRNFLASSLDPAPAQLKNEVIEVAKIERRNARAAFAEIAPSVLVCDIEGAEAELIGLPDLSGLRLAIIELHPQWIGQEGVRAVFEAMHAAGLTYYPRTSDKKVVTFLRDW